MNCPRCNAADTRVIDSRSAQEGKAVRRRRQCTACGHRFTTYEYVEGQPLMVIKNDQRRVPFDREKILRSVSIACKKRPVSMDDLNRLTDEIIQDLNLIGVPEITTRQIGETVLRHLRDLDEVAYVRFASVYRNFQDIQEFKKALDNI